MIRYTERITDRGLDCIMAATEPIRDKKQFKTLAEHFLEKGQLCNYIYYGCLYSTQDQRYVAFEVGDVYEEERQKFHIPLTLKEKKIGKIKIITLNQQVLGVFR